MAAAAAASAAKADDGAIDRRSSGYKSWKKKYRKMRIVFDQKMHQGEDLRRQEDKASATVKRLAIENDRLLDILLEVNNSPQMPPERRVDVTLAPPANATAPVLAMDARQAVLQGDKALKRLEQLLSDVPHSSYGTAKELHSPLVADLVTADGDALPANFLSADDIDNYMFAIDLTLDPDAQLPTLAPRAHLQAHSVLHPHLKNPTSVTSWLRKHARKIFLQDGEPGAADGTYDVDGGPSGAGTFASASAAGVSASSATGSAIGGHQTPLGRRPRGANKADRGISRGSRGKRATARLAAERPGDDASMDDDAVSGATPVGRSKRKRDDDPGYRPGGSSNRPAKKKRKSDLDGSTPIVRRSKKEASAAAWGAGNAAGTGGSNRGD